MKNQTGSLPYWIGGFIVLMIAAFSLGVSTKALAGQADEAVRRGSDVYVKACAVCHGTTLRGGPGGPALVSTAFRAKWMNKPAEALAAYMRQTMPLGSPRSLPDAAYSDAAAFVRQRNAVPVAGDASPAVTASVAAIDQAQEYARDVPALPKPRSIAILAGLTPVTDALLRTPPTGDWLQWRGGYDTLGFSKLTQINRQNVGGLRHVWSLQLAPGVNEVAPLVHDGVMYVASAGRLEALDAATGERLWRYTDPSGRSARTLTLYGELIYLAAGANLLALDIHTGHVVWNRPVVSADSGSGLSSGPLAAKGKLIQGARCRPGATSECVIIAYDADTGREAWRFDTVAQAGTPGGDTWNGLPANRRFGAGVWIPGSYSPELNLVFVGTGQIYPISTLIRDDFSRADALFTSSTLALNPDTGKLVWYYQHLPGEVWDLDWAFERTIAPMNIDGKRRLTVTTGGKAALFDTLDAATGKYLFSRDAGIQSLISSVDPVTGKKTINPDAVLRPGVAVRVCPSAVGGRNWPSTAYNPSTGILYLPANEACMSVQWNPTPGDGTDDDDNVRTLLPRNPGGNIGRVQAIDLVQGKTLWTRSERSPQASAILATAGGLIFEGNRDRWFRASDDQTGKVLWQTRLDSSVSSYPMTYSVGGVQYVAVASGGGNALDGKIGSLAPEVDTPVGGVTLWAFSLDGSDVDK